MSAYTQTLTSTLFLYIPLELSAGELIVCFLGLALGMVQAALLVQDIFK